VGDLGYKLKDRGLEGFVGVLMTMLEEKDKFDPKNIERIKDRFCNDFDTCINANQTETRRPPTGDSHLINLIDQVYEDGGFYMHDETDEG